MPEGTLLAFAIVAVLGSAFNVFHQLYQQKLALDIRLAPNIIVDPNPRLQESVDHISGQKFQSYYLKVRNSSSVPIKGVIANLVDIDPPVPQMKWLPIPLHVKHNNIDPHEASFDLNPLGEKLIDLITYPMNGSNFRIDHAVLGVNCALPVGKYLLSVSVEGEAIGAPRIEKFMVRTNYRGHLICLSANYLDLDKGQIEMSRDAQAIMKNRINPSVDGLNAATVKIARISEQILLEIKDPISMPLAWYEPLIGINSPRERMVRRAPTWSKKLDAQVAFLKKHAAAYRAAANEVSYNITGYVDLAGTASDEDLESFRTMASTTLSTHQSLSSFRESVRATQRERMLTELTRSMRGLGVALDEVVDVTQEFSETFAILVEFIEAKPDEATE